MLPGEPEKVVLLIEDWKRILRTLSGQIKSSRVVAFEAGLLEALQEVKDMEEGKSKMQTFDELLKEVG